MGPVAGLGADAATLNPLLGGDALEPLIDAAAEAGAGVFAIVRTSNPGAADLLDLPAPERPLFERLAELVAERAPRLAGEEPQSGMGAVVGATEPRHLARLRELMPDAIFLLPGVGAQGGRPEALGTGARPAPRLDPGRGLTLDRGCGGPGRGRRALRDRLWAARNGAARRPARNAACRRRPRRLRFAPRWKLERASAGPESQAGEPDCEDPCAAGTADRSGGDRGRGHRLARFLGRRGPAAAIAGREVTSGCRPDAENAVEAGYYVIEVGEDLSIVADRTCIPIERLMRLNENLDPQLIQVGPASICAFEGCKALAEGG